MGINVTLFSPNFCSFCYLLFSLCSLLIPIQLSFSGHYVQYDDHAHHHDEYKNAAPPTFFDFVKNEYNNVATPTLLGFLKNMSSRSRARPPRGGCAGRRV